MSGRVRPLRSLAVAEPIKVAIFGTGYAEEHVYGYRRRNDVEIVAVCSKRKESAEFFARKYGIPLATTSYEEALSVQGLRAISVSTPPNTHLEIARAAIERGLHVLCEKPLARTAVEAATMLEEAERAGVIHATNYDYRIVPDIEKFHRLLQDGYVGEILYATMRWMGSYHADPDAPWTWRNSREVSGPGMLGDLSHAIDDLLWHFGSIERVVADVRTLIGDRLIGEGDVRRANDADDAAHFIAIPAAGGHVSGNLSRCAVHGGYRVMESYGAEGMLRMTMPNASSDRWTTKLTGARHEDRIAHDLSSSRPREQVMTTQERFVQAIVDRSVPVETSFADGLAVMVVTDALFESSKAGRWVDVDVDVALG